MIAVALGTNPPRGILIPVMALISYLPYRSLDVIPSALIIQTPPDQLGDERTPPPRPYTTVQLRHHFVLQHYVQSHGRRLAHSQLRGLRLQLVGAKKWEPVGAGNSSEPVRAENVIQSR